MAGKLSKKEQTKTTPKPSLTKQDSSIEINDVNDKTIDVRKTSSTASAFLTQRDGTKKDVTDVDSLSDLSDEDKSLDNYLSDIQETSSLSSDLPSDLIKEKNSLSLEAGSPEVMKQKERKQSGIHPVNPVDLVVDTRTKRRKNMSRRKTVEELLSNSNEYPEKMENGNRVIELEPEAAHERAVEDLSHLILNKVSTVSNPDLKESPLQRELRHMLQTEIQHLEDITDIIKDKPDIMSALGKHGSPVFFHTVQEIQSSQGWIVSILENLCFKGNTNIDALIQKLCERQQTLAKYAQTVPVCLRILNAKIEQTKISTSERNQINILQKPLTWIMQTIENIKRLKTLISSDDLTFQALVDAEEELLGASYDLENTSSKLSVKKKPLKMSLLVELHNPPTFDRKLRTIFLFDNFIACARQRVVILRKHFIEVDDEKGSSDELLFDSENASIDRKLSQTSDPVTLKMNTRGIRRYELKWFIPLKNLDSVSTTERAFDEESLRVRLRTIENLKSKIKMTQEELRQEGQSTDKDSKRRKLKAPKIHRLRSYLHELQAELILQSPRLPLFITASEGQTYCVLTTSEKERVDWKQAISQAKDALESGGSGQNSAIAKKLSSLRSFSNQFKDSNKSLPMSSSEVSSIINHCKTMPLNHLGTTLISGNALYGILQVGIHEITGLEEIAPYYVSLEVEFCGQFESVAKTRCVFDSSNPVWNQFFMIELESSQMACFTVHRHSTTIAQLDVPLRLETLEPKFEQTFTLQTFEVKPRTITLKISLSFTERRETLNKHDSVQPIFGRPIGEILKRDQRRAENLRKFATVNRAADGATQDGETAAVTLDSVNVPSIVVACVEEIERRGMREEGIYRINGSSSSFNYLKEQFNQNLKLAQGQIGDYDINSVASLLKLFFRELPEPLIQSTTFKALADALSIADKKEKYETFNKILRAMPAPPRDTFMYLLQHLVRVSKHESDNKMNLGSLSLIWAMTLFQPSTSSKTKVDSEELPELTNRNVRLATTMSMIQAQILRELLKAMEDSALEFISTEL